MLRNLLPLLSLGQLVPQGGVGCELGSLVGQLLLLPLVGEYLLHQGEHPALLDVSLQVQDLPPWLSVEDCLLNHWLVI